MTKISSFVISLIPRVSELLLLNSSYFANVLSMKTIDLLYGRKIGSPLYMISLDNRSSLILSVIDDRSLSSLEYDIISQTSDLQYDYDTHTSLHAYIHNLHKDMQIICNLHYFDLKYNTKASLGLAWSLDLVGLSSHNARMLTFKQENTISWIISYPRFPLRIVN
jgi:hypothetical protein